MVDDIEIEIGGQTFRVAAGDASPEYLQRLARYVDERMKAILHTAKTMPLTRVAILTALNIADDLLKLQDHTEQASHLFNSKTDHLVTLMHEQLAEH